MIERKKVIRGLECCLPSHDPDCDLCPYDDIDLRCRVKLYDDIMVLLKVQEESPTDAQISSAIECLLHPQDADDSDMEKAIDTAIHAMQLLKVQKPVKPNEIWHGNMFMYYQCPSCMSTLRVVDKYCSQCGRTVKWE